MFLGFNSSQSSSSQPGCKCQQHPAWMAVFPRMLLEHNSSLVPGIHRCFACRLPPHSNAEKQSVDVVLFPVCLLTILHTHNYIELLTSMAEEEMVNKFLSTFSMQSVFVLCIPKLSSLQNCCCVL